MAWPSQWGQANVSLGRIPFLNFPPVSGFQKSPLSFTVTKRFPPPLFLFRGRPFNFPERDVLKPIVLILNETLSSLGRFLKEI